MGYCHLVPPPVPVLGKGQEEFLVWGPISLTFLALRVASPGPGGAEAAGAKVSGAGRCGNGRFVEVGAHTTNVHPCREKREGQA